MHFVLFKYCKDYMAVNLVFFLDKQVKATIRVQEY